jgi:hypothetical protein
MKIKMLLTSLLSFVFYLLSSQIPQGFSYQAVARNPSGSPIINTALPVRITIQSDSLGGTIFWQELHPAVITSNLGAINLVLGKGAKQAGVATTFSAIDWRVTPKFIKTEIDYSGWRTMGVSRLWSVPYAMIAGDLDGPVKKLAVTGETTLPEEALFEVKNKDGQTVFAVYNEGVRVYVDDGIKGVKGGFAVGGFGSDKQESQKYLVVTRDSTRIYLDNNPLQKKTKGGFAVGGYDATKGTIVPFVELTPKNYFIGDAAGLNNKDGLYNIFIGHQAGYSTIGPSGAVGGSEGSWNCFIGYQAGFANQHGANNTLIGYSAGMNSVSDHNTFLGAWAGVNNTSGYSNTFIGTRAGSGNVNGGYNVCLGRLAGVNVKNGNWNTFIGTAAGANIQSGEKNIVIGNDAMGENLFAGSGTGSSNIVIGYQAGYSASNSSSNIFIGNQAGYSETGSNKLIIENSSSATPLISGDFTSDFLKINGSAEAVAFTQVSDIALKKNITQLTDAVEKLSLLRGIYFDWNTTENPGVYLKGGRQIGVIAQEVEKVFPELVWVNDLGFKTVDYTKLSPILIEAVREQQNKIEDQQKQLESQNERITQLEKLISEIQDKTVSSQ